MRPQGERALVTGAGCGIGLAFAEGFTPEGAQVATADIDRAHDASRGIDGAMAVRIDETCQDNIDAAVGEDRLLVAVFLASLDSSQVVSQAHAADGRDGMA